MMWLNRVPQSHHSAQGMDGQQRSIHSILQPDFHRRTKHIRCRHHFARGMRRGRGHLGALGAWGRGSCRRANKTSGRSAAFYTEAISGNDECDGFDRMNLDWMDGIDWETLEVSAEWEDVKKEKPVQTMWRKTSWIGVMG